MKSIRDEFEVDGKGGSKITAYENAFQNLRVGINEKYAQKYIVLCQTVEVTEISVNIEKYTERFLFLFLPREKEKVSLRLLIEVEIKYID